MKTLVIVDPQNDFMPGGSLEVPRGDEIISVINGIQDQFDLVIATQDWHPENHMSFASNHAGKEAFDTIDWQGKEQILWPEHCIQGLRGAEFHPGLNAKPIEAIFRKGMNPEIDSYSGFYDNNHEKNTGLAGYLRERKSDEVYFCGLAADVCVYFSVMDSIKEGFTTFLIEDATRPIAADKYRKQKEEITAKGCRLVTGSELKAR